jgi:excisionase family DNA binding protein
LRLDRTKRLLFVTYCSKYSHTLRGIGVDRNLLTTNQLAELLQVHPKHVYRLLKRGLPGRRVGGEWRFDREEVLSWTEGSGTVSLRERPEFPPPILATNGDLAAEVLLSLAAESGPPFLGTLTTDGGGGLELLRTGQVLASGYHGPDPVPSAGAEPLVQIHIVSREIGFTARDPLRLPWLEDLYLMRFASRPVTAGVRRQLDCSLHQAGIDPAVAHQRARLFGSHRDVVVAVARGEVDAGIATRAWARRLGLAFRPLTSEDYGIVGPPRFLGDPRIQRLADIASELRFRQSVEALGGYDASSAGELRLHTDPC